jgi:hypothetical protein
MIPQPAKGTPCHPHLAPRAASSCRHPTNPLQPCTHAALTRKLPQPLQQQLLAVGAVRQVIPLQEGPERRHRAAAQQLKGGDGGGAGARQRLQQRGHGRGVGQASADVAQQAHALRLAAWGGGGGARAIGNLRHC